jgi:hypothetical protein
MSTIDEALAEMESLGSTVRNESKDADKFITIIVIVVVI